MMTTKAPVSVSLNGPDNVGKTTQLHWLARGTANASLVGTLSLWDPRWQTVAYGDFARWWFHDSTTREHVEIVFSSHAARRRGSGRLALEDRGWPMLVALCAATAAVKEDLAAEEALGLVEDLAAQYPAAPRHEIHVLLHHADDPAVDARLALAREEQAASRWYADYQHALATVLRLQVRRGDYDLVIVRGDRPILPIQRGLRHGLRTLGLPVEPLPPSRPDRLWVLAGLSECGKSTVGDLLRVEHGTTRLKIGYLLDVAAARAGLDDPYTYWDEASQAEALTEEVLRFCARNPGNARISVESAHRLAATRHLQRIWGEDCHVIYIDADSTVRMARSEEDIESTRSRDQTKQDRGAHQIADIADWRIDNCGGLADLKFAVHRLASTATTLRTPGTSPQEKTINPPWVRRWLTRAVCHLVDPDVAAVLATGSTGRAAWHPGWSDLDLLVVRDELPASWLRETAATLTAPDGVKVGLTLFTAAEVTSGHIPPRLVHAFRLAARNGEGVLHLRGDFAFPAASPDGDDRAARAELPLIASTLRRLVAKPRFDVRGVYKHVVLMMKIILRAESIAAETSDEVVAAFARTFPAAGVRLPALHEVTARNWHADRDLDEQLLAATGAILDYYDRLVRADALTQTNEEAP